MGVVLLYQTIALALSQEMIATRTSLFILRRNFVNLLLYSLLTAAQSRTSERQTPSSMASPSPATKVVFPFFDLPPELRDMIYVEALTEHEYTFGVSPKFIRIVASNVPTANGLSINRRFHDEYKAQAEKRSAITVTDIMYVQPTTTKVKRKSSTRWNAPFEVGRSSSFTDIAQRQAYMLTRTLSSTGRSTYQLRS